MVASPAIANAEGDEQGGPGPAATGGEQVLANETPADGETGSSNDPAAEAQPAVLETSGEVRESNTIEQGSSPAVVIGSSGGSHNSGDDEDARPVSRQAEAPPITGAVEQNSPAAVPPALAGPALMQMNVVHPPGHGGGEPAPAPALPPNPAAPYNLSPASHLFTAFKALVEPLMAQAPGSIDPVLSAYLYLQNVKVMPNDPFAAIMNRWGADLTPPQTTIADPATATAPQGALSRMIEAMGAGMEPMMSPAFDPLLNLYASFLLPQQLGSVPTSAFDFVIENWKAKLALEDLKSYCSMNSGAKACAMEHRGAAEGAVPVLVDLWANAVAQMSPGIDPLLSLYDMLLPARSHDHDDPNAVIPTTPLGSIHHKWTTKLGMESYEARIHMKMMMRSCKMDPGGGACDHMARMSGADGGHNHGGGGSNGSTGPMSMMAMMAMMAMPKMPEMTHGDCMGGTFLMCNQGAGVEATYNDHDVMFLNHMIPHHGQAVLMSRIVLGKDDLDPRVAALAEQIKNAQGPEIRLMESWLDSWGNPPSDMVGDHGILPPQDILALRRANGADASVLFLQQMTYHHNGAVDASLGHLMGGQFEPSLQLAHDIIGAQQTEILTMSDLLASLGASGTGPNVPVAPSGGQPLQPSGGGSSSSSGGHHH